MAFRVQPLQCFFVAHAMYWAFQILVMGRSLPDTSAKDKYYRDFLFTASAKKTTQMDLVQHGDDLKEAQQKAGYAPIGLVTHRDRHEVPASLRVVHDVRLGQQLQGPGLRQAVTWQADSQIGWGTRQTRLCGILASPQSTCSGRLSYYGVRHLSPRPGIAEKAGEGMLELKCLSAPSCHNVVQWTWF